MWLKHFFLLQWLIPGSFSVSSSTSSPCSFCLLTHILSMSVSTHGHMTIALSRVLSPVLQTGQWARAKDMEGVFQLNVPTLSCFLRSYTQQSLLMSHWLELSYSSPPYLQGHTFQEPQWTPETADSTESYTYSFFLNMHTFSLKESTSSLLFVLWELLASRLLCVEAILKQIWAIWTSSGILQPSIWQPRWLLSD